MLAFLKTMLDINKFSNKFMFSRFFHLMSDITSNCRVVKHYQSQDKDKDEDDKDKDRDRETGTGTGTGIGTELNI